MKIGELKYPKYEKCPVRVTYNSWKGYDPDAYHIIVEIIEHYNYKWDGKFWCGMFDKQGKRFRQKFATHKSAEEYVATMIKKYFPKKTHKVEIRDLT